MSFRKGLLLKLLLLFLVVLLPCSQTAAQSVERLQEAFSGAILWEDTVGRLTFTSSGTIDFQRADYKGGIWEVPEVVLEIVIAEHTKVSGQFTLRHDCKIRGEDQETSVLHGTDERELLHRARLDQGGGCIEYSSVLGRGKITLYIENLTTLNPIGYMWTGKQGAKLHLNHVRGIDDRGGWHNHSDGISAAAGSTVRNCYLETGDDAIKVYSDILVEDTTIVMIQNCVPIQLGWGSYGNNATGVFKNLTILGDRGRGKPPAVIVGRKGSYQKNIQIDGLVVRNPNAALVSLYEKGMELDLEITNAEIAVKQFWGENEGKCLSRINGSTDQVNRYPADSR